MHNLKWILTVYLSLGCLGGNLLKISHVNAVCLLKSTSISDGCKVISTGWPINQHDSIYSRAIDLGGNWKSLSPTKAMTKVSDACPNECVEDNIWLAVDRNTPGHAYRDVVRSARYSQCGGAGDIQVTLPIKSVLLTGANPKKDEKWPHYFLEIAFPKAAIHSLHLTPSMRDKNPPYYPIKPGRGQCCAVCAAVNISSVKEKDTTFKREDIGLGGDSEGMINPSLHLNGPWYNFSYFQFNRLRCRIWSHVLSLELQRCEESLSRSLFEVSAQINPLSSEEVGGGDIIKVLLVKRKGKRSFSSDVEIADFLKNFPRNKESLRSQMIDVENPLVQLTEVYLETLLPKAQCEMWATHDIIVAMHGSALGNIFCATPKSVVIEIFPSGVYMDMFGLLSTASQVYHLALVDGNRSTVMTRQVHHGVIDAPWTEAQSRARDVSYFQPSLSSLHSAMQQAVELTIEKRGGDTLS